MFSTTNPGDDNTNFPNSQVLMHDMLELMRDIRDSLRENHKKHEETEACKAAPLITEQPGHEHEREVTAQGGQVVAEEGDRPDRSTKPTIPKRFGIKKEHIQRTNPIAANYDYRQKYPEDRQYYEHDPEARVWWVYLDEATAFDNDMIGELGDSLDILLVFAGLFSAVVTTFVAQSSQALSIDYASLSASYLGEISTILRASENSSISQIPLTDTTFSPNAGDIWVNGLWFTSLTIALSVALFAVLAKQWLRQYMSIVTGTPRERTFIRQFRFDGLKAWKVQAIIGILPVLLHLSLVLFLIGLVVFLVPLNIAIAYVTGVITASIVILYLAASVLPLCVVQCPYRTTFSDLLYYISQLPRVAYQRFRLPWHLRWHPESRTGHFNVLKDVERRAACHIEEDHQDLILNALWWLGESTSNVSAKEILLCSLGAFTPRMSNKLCTPEALRVLYGCEAYSDLVGHVLRNLGAPLEAVFRSMIHLSGSMLKFMEAGQWKKKILGSLLTSSDINLALAFCASDAPIDFEPFDIYEGILRPSEGLSWLVDNYKAGTPISVYVPPLVWMGLFKASSNRRFRKAFAEYFPNSLESEVSRPIACPVPVELLIKLSEEGNDASTANIGGAHRSDEPLNHSSVGKETGVGMRVEVRMEQPWERRWHSFTRRLSDRPRIQTQNLDNYNPKHT